MILFFYKHFYENWHFFLDTQNFVWKLLSLKIYLNKTYRESDFNSLCLNIETSSRHTRQSCINSLILDLKTYFGYITIKLK